jgi:hypothetical protein
MPDRSKHFVLPYEPDYAAHRTDDQTRRVTKLHLKAREPVPGPSLMPELADVDEADKVGKVDKTQVKPRVHSNR